MIPRLKELYYKEIQPQLKETLGYKNTYMGPKVEKVVINTGVKEAVQDSKVLKGIEEAVSKPYELKVKMLNSSGPDNQVFIAICPSGNFYGSEQTLAIYLKHSKLPYLLYMPQDAREEQIQAFQGCENVDLIFFRSERQLYLRIFLALLNRGKPRRGYRLN